MTRTRCSIVIPVHNKLALTRQCLDSILEHPPEVEHEILVVDDASTDGTPEMLAEYGSAVRSIRLHHNAGFATACNTGAHVGAGEFILFLNNDTIALPGWLDELVDHADRHGAAVVGSKLLFSDGTIQHAGVVFSLFGNPRHIYAGWPADHPAVNKSRPFQSVTAACCLVRRHAYEVAGGFDTSYHNDLEDVDLCLRLGELGYAIHYCHRSVLYHLESASRGLRDRPQLSARVYRQRWVGRVRSDEFDYYLQDGLLELLRYSPERVEIERRRRPDVELLQARTRQMMELLRETVHVASLTAPDDEGTVPRLPLTVRRRAEQRIERLRAGLAAGIGPEEGADSAAEAEPEPEPEPTPAPEPEPEAAAETAPETGPGGYSDLLSGMQQVITEAVPPGAVVAIASHGDERLLGVEGREAWHFPRSAGGEHLGYHPATSEDAIEHVEELRTAGAGYLVFPATETWWLEHYDGLAEHLRDRYERVRDEAGVCVVFELVESLVPDVVSSLIPPRTKIAVLSEHEGDLIGLDDQLVLRLAPSEDEAAVTAELEYLAQRGVAYLVVPRYEFAWLASAEAFARHLRSRHRFVTRQAHACEVYELVQPSRPEGRAAGTSATAGAPR